MKLQKSCYFMSTFLKIRKCCGRRKEKRSLAYEVEYLLEGKTSDQENLEAVLNKMLLIRMGLNFVYLQTDTAKQAEAGAMALALATAVALPMLEPVVKQVLLAAWAFGESVRIYVL